MMMNVKWFYRRSLALLLLVVMMVLPFGLGGCAKAAEIDKWRTIQCFKTLDTVDFAGKAVTSERLYANKLTVVNIWGTFCGPCIREMPELGELSREYRSQGVEIIGLCGDMVVKGGKIDNNVKAEAERIMAQTKADYLELIPSAPIINEIIAGPLTAFPTTLFLNNKGEIIDVVIGSQSKASWEQLIRHHLTAQG